MPVTTKAEKCLTGTFERVCCKVLAFTSQTTWSCLTEERSFMFPIVLCDEIFEVLKIPAVCPSKIPNWATPGTQTALAPSKWTTTIITDIMLNLRPQSRLSSPVVVASLGGRRHEAWCEMGNMLSDGTDRPPVCPSNDGGSPHNYGYYQWRQADHEKFPSRESRICYLLDMDIGC